MVGLRQAALLRNDVDEHGNRLSAQQREQLLKPFLPESKEELTSAQSPENRTKTRSRKPIRTFIRTSFHVLVFNMMQLVFSIFYRIRRAYRRCITVLIEVMYHHHRTPELIQKDVRGFKKVPKHLSVNLSSEGRMDGAALETLINNVCECAAWTACAGIPMLSIYERSGVLKSSLPQLHRHISNTLASYYGSDSATRPTISLRAPQIPAFSPPSPSSDPSRASSPQHLTILLLSESDGRRTLVDLTKTLAEMSQKHKLAPEDISTELIDAELSESVMGEPDLLILFGDSVVLDGYPPWQMRLTEIFHVRDNHEVSYQVFLRGLHKYAGAQMRFGS